MAALVPLLLHLGLANAQVNLPGVPNPVAPSSSAGNNAVGVSSSGNAGITPGVNIGGGCPSVLTLTVIPPDYTGSLISLPISLWPSLPTLSVPPISLPSISIPDLSITVPPLTGISGLPLPTINPSATLDLPTLSLPISALLPTIPLPSGTPVSYTCPEQDGRLIIQNLLPYVVDCGATPTGTVFTSVPATNSFNDCFQQCDRASTDQGAKYCTGFYYEGVTDGDGAGTCYLQNSVAQGFSNSTAGASNRVAAVRLLNYLVGGGPLLPPLLGDITSQLPGQISSLISEVGGVLPTNLPITTALPNAISSILGGVTSGLPNGVSSLLNDLTSGLTLPTNLPITTILPTNLPITTELPNAISSILGGVTSGLPGGVSSLINDLTSGLTIPTNVPISSILSEINNLPTNVPVSSLINDLSSVLNPSGLPITNLPVSSLINDLSSVLNPSGLPTNLPISSLQSELSSLLGNPTQGIPGAVSSLLGSQGLPSVISSLLNPSGGGVLSSLINDLTAVPTITPPVSLPSNFLPSGSLPSLTNVLPTSLPSGITPSISVPSGIIPTSLPSGFIPPISIPSLGTNLISTTGANGLPTLISITPTIVAPSLTVSLPTDLSLSGALTNLIPTTGLGGVTTLVSVPTDLSLTVPSLSLSVPSLSVPSISVSVPSLSVPSLSLSAPSLSVPSLSISNILPSIGLPGGGSGTTPTGTSSRSALIPTATAFPIFGCPGDSGLAYVSPSGQAFAIQCNTQVLGYDISTALQPDLQSCVNSCGGVPGCTNTAYQASTGICSYKSQNGQSISATTDFSAAIAIDLSCPNGNGVIYMDPYGSNYQILCNYTFPSRTEISQSPAPGGRLVDERSLEVAKRAPSDASFLACSVQCSLLSGCIAVTEQNDVCLFISDLGPAGTDSNIADTVVLMTRRIVSVNATDAPLLRYPR
ncbi:hypothetical protein PRZ48_007596 [Zasmidium cellare]|uniref:Apple domain-containing protein n=1 Tax=Zasmidium cellare TaxID=395010 RepID=A0ABR0EJR8_ZASCE|nr:hypothetical protein PRZ48_007596 [Zasmidium cellare]